MGPHRRNHLEYALYAQLDRPAQELTPTPIQGVYRDGTGMVTVRLQGRIGAYDRGQIERAIERARVEIFGGIPGHPLAGP